MNSDAFDALSARLIDHARKLGQAAAAMRRDPARGWRDARLVWPLFNARQTGN